MELAVALQFLELQPIREHKRSITPLVTLMFLASIVLLEYILRPQADPGADTPSATGQKSEPVAVPDSAGLLNLGSVLERYGKGQNPEREPQPPKTPHTTA